MSTNILNTIERRNYLATAGEIRTVMKENVKGSRVVARAQSSFLKCLVARTQKELGIEPRLRAVPGPKIRSEEDRAAQMKTLNAIYKEFYEDGVLKALPAPCGNAERQSLTGFARSSVSELRGWLREGYDITTLAPAKVSKQSLREDRTKKAAKEEPIQNVVIGHAARLQASALRLAEEDKAEARKVLETAMQRLGETLMSLKPKLAKNVSEAVRDARPVSLKDDTIFMPLRQMTPATQPANARAA